MIEHLTRTSTMNVTKICDADNKTSGTNETDAGMPHMGELIRKHLEQKGIAGSWLAERLGIHRTSVYKMLRRPSIDTDTLYKISILLNYNFFETLTAYFIKNDKPLHPVK